MPNLRPIRQVQPSNKQRRGAMVVMLAVMLILFFVTVAFSVDIAYMHLVRGELRTSTDAAAKAASTVLSQTQDTNQAIARAQEIALDNTVAGQGLMLTPADFQFGNSAPDPSGRFIFNPSKTPLNSVRVTGRRTGSSPSGSVGLFFGRVLGRDFFEPQDSATATYLERDVVLVVDRSGSMLGQKFNDLRRAIGVFAATLGTNTIDEHVGLASYSTFATEDVPLTSDLNLLNVAMARMSPNGFTSISRGMEAGENIMNGSRARDFVERTMVVMTDGIHNTAAAPEGVAQRIANDGVVIHTITFGADAEQDRMQRVAAIGHGRHFHADNGLQLEQVFREIALTLSTIITE